MTTFPGDPDVEIGSALTIERDGVNVLAVHIGSQTGTHVDAPSHVLSDGPRLDELPLDRFIGPAAVADVRHVDADAPITWQDLHLVRTRPGAVLLLHTGWSRDFDDYGRYRSHPWLDPGAATRIVDAGIRTVGIDALNIDATPEDLHAIRFDTHEVLLGAGGVIVENLTRLEDVAMLREPVVTVFPLKLPAPTAPRCAPSPSNGSPSMGCDLGVSEPGSGVGRRELGRPVAAEQDEIGGIHRQGHRGAFVQPHRRRSEDHQIELAQGHVAPLVRAVEVPLSQLPFAEHERSRSVEAHMLGPDRDRHSIGAVSPVGHGDPSERRLDDRRDVVRSTTSPSITLLSPMNPAENSDGAQVHALGGTVIFDPAVAQDDDGVGERHRLLLVVRDVDERGSGRALDACQLVLHLAA